MFKKNAWLAIHSGISDMNLLFMENMLSLHRDIRQSYLFTHHFIISRILASPSDAYLGTLPAIPI